MYAAGAGRGTRRIGRYDVVTRLDSTAAGAPPAPERNFIAGSSEGDRTEPRLAAGARCLGAQLS